MTAEQQASGPSSGPLTLHFSLQDMEKFAAELAMLLTQGDTLTLKGDLGAGKTTFARALIRAKANDPTLEVPSPTFPLCIPYETASGRITHFDLYRLSDQSELEEIGFYDALEHSLTLIEWPENAGPESYRSHCAISFEEQEQGESRKLEITANGPCAERLTRLLKVQSFLREAGWQAASWQFLQGDASTRSYIRLNMADQKALLMNAPPQPDGPPIKDNKPYSQIAHLAEDMTSFVAISKDLTSKGFALPNIIKHDIDAGLLLIEDFGDDQYHHLITNENQPKAPLYQAAIEVLVELRGYKPGAIEVNNRQYTLPTYDRSTLKIETDLLIEWYWPFVKQETCSETAKSDYAEIWQTLFNKVMKEDYDHWVLRDYHSPNLMKLPGQSPLQQVGIIDFQDALKGHAAYDLVSLCQDARLTIEAPSEEAFKAHYCQRVAANDPAFNQTAFQSAYAILGAQRSCKLLGIFVRLSKRDGKHHYQAHIPRIWDYLERNLQHKDLAPLKEWFQDHFKQQQRAEFFMPNKTHPAAPASQPKVQP